MHRPKTDVSRLLTCLALCIIIVICDIPDMISSAGSAPGSAGKSTGSRAAATNPRDIEYNEPDGLAEAKDFRTYRMDELEGGKEYRFYNMVEGYSIVVPADMKVTDMSNSEVVSVLEDEHRRLEIYVERNTYPRGYVAYGYRCLDDKESHDWTHNVTLKISGRTAYIRQWERPKLKGISDDHNYYAAIDIIDGNDVYDFFFTSDQPFWKSGYYHDIVNSFKKTEADGKGVTIKGKPAGIQSYWNDETRALYSTYLDGESGLEWGMYNPSANYGYGYDDLKQKEKVMNHHFDYLLVYSSITPDYNSAKSMDIVRKNYDDGRYSELTLQSPLNMTGRNMMYEILDGNYDKFLISIAKDIADFGHPVFVRLFNEMNGDWCNYSAYHTSRDTMIYKKVYRYIWNVFADQGACANTLWIWNPNGGSFPDYTWNDQRCYYPGDKYVDIVGITAYNTGNYYKDEKWTEFTEKYDPIYREITAEYSHPIFITEFSCAVRGGDKLSWINTMFEEIQKYKKIKVAIWWDGCDMSATEKDVVSRDYRIDSPVECMDAFKAYFEKYASEKD